MLLDLYLLIFPFFPKIHMLVYKNMKYILLILYTYFKHKLYTSSFCLLPWGTSLRHSMFPFVGTKKVQIIYDFLKLFLKFHSLHKFCFDPWIKLLKIISIKHSENTSQASVSLLPKSPLLVQESHMFPALPSCIENLAWFLLVWSFLFAHKSKSYYYHIIFSSVMFYSVWYMGTITLYVRVLNMKFEVHTSATVVWAGRAGDIMHHWQCYISNIWHGGWNHRWKSIFYSSANR